MAELEKLIKGEPDWHNKVNQNLNRLNNQIESGTTKIPATTTDAVDHVVQFASPFDGVPIIMPVVSTNSGYQSGVHVRTRSETGFTLRFFPGYAPAEYTIAWIALGNKKED